MQLKRDEFYEFMVKHHLTEREPSEILMKYTRYAYPDSKLNRGDRYFFDSYIRKSDYRKSLKKKFDNIINVDIKAMIRKK